MIMKKEAELTVTKRLVWNAGRTVGAKRAMKPKQIWEIRLSLNQVLSSVYGPCAARGKLS
jgi:hypothetical protein